MIRAFLLFCTCLAITNTCLSQGRDKPFITMDTILIPKDKKGRLELALTRYLKNSSFLASKQEYEISESFSGVLNRLEIKDILLRPDTHYVLIHIAHNIVDKYRILSKIIHPINKNNLNKNAGVFVPVCVSDSLGFYKYALCRINTDSASIIKFINEPYALNLKTLHENTGRYLENSCYIYLINANNINNNPDVIINSVISNKKVEYDINRAPVIIPYIIDETEVPAYLANFIEKRQGTVDTIYTDPGFNRFPHIFKGKIISSFPLSYILTLDTKKPVYMGEERTLMLRWNKGGLTDTLHYFGGSSDSPLNIKELEDAIFWPSCLLFGFLFLLAIFFVLSIIYPILEEKKFVKKYVSPYYPVNNVVKLDTMTNEPIVRGTLVVTRCKEIVPYYIWKGLGNQCPSYPECMDYLGCDGCGKSDTSYRFFSQSGNMKKFNWLFYGACGGFIAWMLTLLLTPLLFRLDFGALFQWLHADHTGHKIALSSFGENIARQAGAGLGIGLGLSAALVMADYISCIIRSHLWIYLLKIITCGFLNALAFGLIHAVSIQFSVSPFLSGFLSWAAFALIVSLTLSAASPSIRFKRAILAAGSGVLLSFFLYHLSTKIINLGYNDFSPNRQLFIEFAKIIRLIVLGALTGFIVTNVLNKLEEYELVLQAPDQVSGRAIPISKILNSRAAVTIGSSPKNLIFIKWTDPGAEESHASVGLTNEGVILTAFAEIIVNKEYLNKGSRHLLKDKDIIQLGRHSSTLMQFNIKYT